MPASARTIAELPAVRSTARRRWLWELALLLACAVVSTGTGAGSMAREVGTAGSLTHPPGQSGPPSHNQRAIQALTKAMSTVKGKPIRRKSLKRYWPGPRMRRLPW